MDIYSAVSPVTSGRAKRFPLSPCIPDLSGKTVCAVRRTFRADESFGIIEALLKERYPGLKFIPNTEMPDARPTNKQEEDEFAALLRRKGTDLVLAGNGA